ncbi:MAG: hypothetical protein LHV68_03955 [Elusimicrobia bacterium]|nr:hypothetical protein [Candidatus Liberimonas magnetica]
MKIKLKQSTGSKLKQNIYEKMRFSAFMKSDEKEFVDFINKVENDPLFKKLCFSKDRDQRIISLKKFHRNNYLSYSNELKINFEKDGTFYDIGSLINNKAAAKIQKLGLKNFEKYFLFDEDRLLSDREISRKCKIPEPDVKEIKGLVDELSVRSEFYFPSNITVSPGINSYKIAVIDNISGKLRTIFCSLKFVQGTYVINYSKLESLKKQSVFSIIEYKKITELLKDLELINKRKSTIQKILDFIIEKQEDYLVSGNGSKLKPCTQRELAHEINIDESVVSRAVYGRSIQIPDGSERPLNFFFPSRIDVCKNILRNIMTDNKIDCSDKTFCHILRDEYGINISRRTVSYCRKHM